MKKIKIFLIGFFLISFCNIANFNQAKAEIIDLQKEENVFGDWKVYCETDVMMDNSHCKIASKFFDASSVIAIEPTKKFFNQLFIIIPQARPVGFVTIRVDKGDLIMSQNISANDFGLIKLDPAQKNDLYRQMKIGDFLFLRFNVKGSDKEVTVKISLQDFREALDSVVARF